MSTVAFISYARIKNEYGAAKEFHRALENSLKQCTNMEARISMDTRMDMGVDFMEEIKHDLISSTVLIVSLSPVWLSRPMCRQEYLYFKSLQDSHDKKRFIIPLLWRKVDITDAEDEESKKILEQLNQLNQVDWTKLKFDTDYAKSIYLQVAIEELADDIKKKIKS